MLWILIQEIIDTFYYVYYSATIYVGYAMWETLIYLDVKDRFFFYAINFTAIFTVKLITALMLLILIRGGVPRFRYDLLTKLGWVKFLFYVLTLLILTIFLVLIW